MTRLPLLLALGVVMGCSMHRLPTGELDCEKAKHTPWPCASAEDIRLRGYRPGARPGLPEAYMLPCCQETQETCRLCP